MSCHLGGILLLILLDSEPQQVVGGGCFGWNYLTGCLRGHIRSIGPLYCVSVGNLFAILTLKQSSCRQFAGKQYSIFALYRQSEIMLNDDHLSTVI